MAEFVNLTRSDMKIIADDGTTYVLPTIGRNAHVRKIVRSVYQHERFPITDISYEIHGMPDHEEGKLYVVSWKTLLMMNALGYDTSDVYAPDSFIRSDDGRVSGARSLSRIAQ